MTRSQPRDEAGESRGRLGRGGAARLLLVSDQPVLADLIALTLDHGRFAIKRADTAAAAATFLTRQVPQLVIDILRRTVRIGDSELHLTALEQSLLYLLAANPGRVLTREEILGALWGPDHAVGSNVVDQQVRSLRARLRDDWRRPRFIATARGGYRFVPTSGDDRVPDPSA